MALGVVLVFDAHFRGEDRDWEAGDVASRKNVLAALRSPESVHDDAVHHPEAGARGELDVRLDPESRHHCLCLEHSSVVEHDAVQFAVPLDPGH